MFAEVSIQLMILFLNNIRNEKTSDDPCCYCGDNYQYLCVRTDNIEGRITDSVTGEALPGVSVLFSGSKTGTNSGIDGTYKIENLRKSKYWFR